MNFSHTNMILMAAYLKPHFPLLNLVLFPRYCGMLVAQGGQAVLLALAREIATHATVLKITNMVCFLM